MKLRNVSKDDIQIILQNIDKFKFPVPSMESCAVKKTVIRESGDFIGIGAIKLVGDIYLIFPDEVKKFTKTVAINLLFKEALRQSESLGIDEWHAFIDDDKWAGEIIRHYGFKDIESKYKLSLMLNGK